MANRFQTMPLKLKTYLNKCRCCLQSFESGESITQITEFFEVQFYAFTHIELKPNESLSKFVCEYCHSELVRFSVWKKELIEKQQELYKALNQENSSYEEGSEYEEEGADYESETDGEIASVVEDGEEEEEVIKKENIFDYDEHSSDDDNDVSTELDQDEIVIDSELDSQDEEEDESESGTFASTNDHESDADFNISARQKSRIYSSLTPTSSKGSNLICKNCNKQFQAQKGLTMHIKSCNPELNGYMEKKTRKNRNSDLNAMFVCTCSERFYSRRALNIHRSHKHRQESKSNFKLPAKVSQNGFQKPTKLEIIVNNGYSCVKCPYQTNNRRTLMHHMKSHENNKFFSTTCPHCEKVMSTRSSLVTHINSVHSKSRPFKCEDCDSSFKQLVHLKDHSLSIHQKICKPYRCSPCGESFLTLNALKKHNIIFHRVRNSRKTLQSVKLKKQPLYLAKTCRFVCKCNREFQYKCKLAKHQRLCEIFKQYQEVNGEISTNTTSKIHQCPKCQRTFGRRQNLIRHQKSRGHLDTEQLKNLKIKCEKCTQKFFTTAALDKHLIRGSCLRNI